MVRLAFLTACLPLLLPGICLAAPRYAAPTGSGTACSAASPCDLVTAVNSASANDEVIVTAGNYNLVAQLAPTVDLTIHGSPGAARPVIVGPPATVPLKDINSKVALADLTIQANNEDGVVLFGSASTVDRVEVTSSGGHAAIRTGPDLVVRDSLAISTGTGADAVFLQGASPTTDVVLRNVTAIATGADTRALDVFGTAVATSARIDATNVIADAATDLSANGQNATINANHSNFDTSAGPLGGSENQTTPPLFINAAAGEYREAPTSPTVDSGLSDPLNGSLDLDGRPRITGATTDIGAYELQPAVAPITTVVDKTPPQTKIGRLTLNRRGVVTFTLSCPSTESRCRWSYTLSSSRRVAVAKRHNARKLKVGSGKASAAGGHSTAAHIKVPKPILRYIAAHHGLAVTLAVRGRDAAGNSATVRRTSRLRPAHSSNRGG